jgi:hypothetical protein
MNNEKIYWFKKLSKIQKVLVILFLLALGYFASAFIGLIVTTLMAVYIIYRSRK